MAKSSRKKTDYNPLAHGGDLRKLRRGRKLRPLSSRDPIHLVLKADRTVLNGSFRSLRSFKLVHLLHQRYSRKFFVKTEQIAVEGDHLHLIVRLTRRSSFQGFLRVFSGQISQQFQGAGLVIVPPVTGTLKKLWPNRPFTRVVKGRRAYEILKNYVQLNEKEATGKMPYRKARLRGLTRKELDELWC